MFQLHIYTTGTRAYALRMAELLDPAGKEYFFTSSSKIISCDDHSSRGQNKCLNLVRGCEDFNILILDDTREAWTKENQDNLIVMRRYFFFKYSSQTMCLHNGISLAELKSDESDYLEHILRLLKQIHAVLNNNPFNIDVRQVLKILRSRVLKGCDIVFDSKISHLWKMAVELGATCSTRVDAPSVTHVVATNARTRNSLMAMKNDKLLVCPQWIEAASYMWKKQPEHLYSVLN